MCYFVNLRKNENKMLETKKNDGLLYDIRPFAK